MLVDFIELFPGQRWCIFGGNGSGKSLLAQLLAGHRRESASYVSYAPGFNPRIDIHSVSFEEQQRLWARDNRLDMSEYSADAQDQGTTVEELIRSSRKLKDTGDKVFTGLVEMLDLGSVLQQGIRFLSSGQVRKSLIAKALYAGRQNIPQLLILDDILETVDVNSKSQILKSIEQFHHANSCVIQLCRRKQDIFPSTTHLGLMNSLELVQQGPFGDGSIDTLKGAVEGAEEAHEGLGALLKGNDAAEQVPDPLICMDNVNAGYGELKILDSFTWKMHRGDHLLIEGPNGCGKSTLLGLISGENHKAYGQAVSLFGKRRGSGETIWEVKSYFGIVSNELHNKYTNGWKLLDVVVSGFFDSLGLYDSGEVAQIELASRWLALMGLEKEESSYYQELSFGQQRLTLLARAMVKKPKILILDEPCVGLDDSYRNKILSILDVIASSSKTQLIYVSHVSDERPKCLNRRLRFVANDGGTYDLRQELIES
ncbi:MAG: ATP-binding cassette domain-containing protein [Pseudohongiellaceae bacterium]